MVELAERHERIMASVKEMEQVLYNEVLGSDLAAAPQSTEDFDYKAREIRHKLQWVADEIANLKSREI